MGGLTNSGTIAAHSGITVSTISTFLGGLTNIGVISTPRPALL